MTEPVVVLGAGGFARQIPSLIRDINAVEPRYDIIGFLGPECPRPPKLFPIVGTPSS